MERPGDAVDQEFDRAVPVLARILRPDADAVVRRDDIYIPLADDQPPVLIDEIEDQRVLLHHADFQHAAVIGARHIAAAVAAVQAVAVIEQGNGVRMHDPVKL